MKTARVLWVLAILCIAAASDISWGSTVVVQNASFETGGFGTLSSWTGTGSFGSDDGSIGYVNIDTSSNTIPPDGSRAGYIQGNGSSISQSLSGFAVGSNYWVSYRENLRRGNDSPNMSVSLGGTTIVSDHAVTYNGQYYQPVISSAFPAGNATNTLTFTTTVPSGDRTALVDDVNVWTLDGNMPNAGPRANSSFETPTALGPNGFTYGPGGAHWDFTGGGGIARNGSDFSNPPAPDGTQVAFLQGSGIIFDVFGTFEAGRLYQLTFYDAARPGFGGNTYQVTLGGQTLTFGGNTTRTSTSTSWSSITSDVFTVTFDGPQVLTFTGLNSTEDVTTFFDLIQFIPEPSVLMLLVSGGLLLWRRRNLERH